MTMTQIKLLMLLLLVMVPCCCSVAVLVVVTLLLSQNRTAIMSEVLWQATMQLMWVTWPALNAGVYTKKTLSRQERHTNSRGMLQTHEHRAGRLKRHIKSCFPTATTNTTPTITTTFSLYYHTHTISVTTHTKQTHTHTHTRM